MTGASAGDGFLVAAGTEGDVQLGSEPLVASEASERNAAAAIERRELLGRGRGERLAEWSEDVARKIGRRLGGAPEGDDERRKHQRRRNEPLRASRDKQGYLDEYSP